MTLVPVRDRRAVLRREQWRCAFCRKRQCEQRKETKNDAGLHIHHIWPRNDGGSHNQRNLIALCDDCHALIEAKTRHIIDREAECEEHARLLVRNLVMQKISQRHPSSVNWAMAANYRLKKYNRDS